MAGIGFRLERLARQGGLGTNLAVLFSGTLLSTGHWLATIFGIGITTFSIRETLGLPKVETLLLIFIYSFAFASVATAACLVPSIRRFSNALFEKRPEEAPAHFFSAFVISAGLSLLLAAVFFGLIFGLPFRLVLAGVSFTALMSLLWSAAAFCSAIQAIGAALASYGLGTLVGTVSAIAAAKLVGTVEAVIWAYAAGLSVTLGLLTTLLINNFPFSFDNPIHEIIRQFRSIRREAVLGIGALASALAVWSTTMVIWSSAYGQVSPVGLRFSPLYDAAFFLGLLALVPGLTLMTVFFETDLYRGLRGHLAHISGHATLQTLDASEAGFATRCLSGIGRLMVMQLIVAILMLAVLPLAVEAGLLQHRQLPLAKLVALGTVMHLVLLACSLTLIYLDATRQFALVHLVFLGASVTATVALLPWGERLFGLGYVIGATVAALFAFFTVARTLRHLNSFIFSSALERSTSQSRRAAEEKKKLSHAWQT